MTFATTCVSPDTFKVEEVEKRIERKKERKWKIKIKKEKEEVRNKERKRRDEMR